MGYTAKGEKTEPVKVEAIARALGIEVDVADPYEMMETARKIYDMLQKKGPKVLVLKRRCALVQGRMEEFPYRMRVNQDLCIGEECGCNRYCTRIFRCPGLIWDEENKKAKIDEVICVGCGICHDICPQGAIERLPKKG